MYLEHSRSQQPVYKGSLPSHSDSFLSIHIVQLCLLAIFSLAPLHPLVHQISTQLSTSGGTSKSACTNSTYNTITTVTTQARQEIRIWRGLTQRHMGVRGRTVT
jgi:hypothetical protein